MFTSVSDPFLVYVTFNKKNTINFIENKPYADFATKIIEIEYRYLRQ